MLFHSTEERSIDLCSPWNYDNYSVNDIILPLNNQYDMGEHISVVLWIISSAYVVNMEVADFTFVADSTFLTLVPILGTSSVVHA